MRPIQLLGTAWTVWTLARRRLGPVGAAIVTALVVGGSVYLRSRLAGKVPTLTEGGDTTRAEASPHE